MGSQSYLKVLVICLIAALLGSTQAQLQLGFYAKSCPKAEQIIFNYVVEHVHRVPSLAAALVRLHFHDCFVQGCDASVLLNSTKNNQAEKDSIPNLTLRGFDFIEGIKSLVEAECPGVVSCADVLALSARDSIHAIGGPYWNVPTGRRDGLISRATDPLVSLPAPFHNLTTLLSRFANVGLDVNDLVLLNGAHTIGIAHCSTIANRLYNFTGKGDTDPNLDSEYAKNLKTLKCKNINDKTTLIELDPGSRDTFDLGFYKQVVKRRGLFQSDAALLDSSITRSIIAKQLQSTQGFFVEFAKSIEKMGRINVKIGTEGEIRKHCARVNN
ncbi:peroxidase 3 [Cajanus cajan]|uniref:Peroxidase n=1 Tax=Cajanus cajan TaxID=3821 RepID=A0A151S698_CAJCA|nr:peroxidase 3 [Cajanus cajan]KYP50345.1 Peroxidase 3 [Cajanus cajan]